MGTVFLQCIKKIKIATVVLRMGKGRENVFCEDLQLFVTEEEDSYLYAASTRNQWIESVGSRLRKFLTNWRIEFFAK